MLIVIELLNCELFSLDTEYFSITCILVCLLYEENTVSVHVLGRDFQEPNTGRHYSNIEHSIRVKIRSYCPTKCGPISEMWAPLAYEMWVRRLDRLPCSMNQHSFSTLNKNVISA
jgi:hypothetical protein